MNNKWDLIRFCPRMLIYTVYRRTTYLVPSTNLNGEATISIQSVAYRMWRHTERILTILGNKCINALGPVGAQAFLLSIEREVFSTSRPLKIQINVVAVVTQTCCIYNTNNFERTGIPAGYMARQV